MTRRGGTLIVPVPAGSHFDLVDGRTPLAHCLAAMLAPSHEFETVVVAAAAGHVDEVRDSVPVGVTVVAVPGSPTRTDCLRNVEVPDYAVIHDVSRPLTPSTVRDRVIDSLIAGHEFVVPALVVTDSVKAVDDDGSVVATVDRSTLRATQFPRGFSASLLRRVLESADDELDFALREGVSITMVDGDPDGFEIRTPRDTELAEAIIGSR